MSHSAASGMGGSGRYQPVSKEDESHFSTSVSPDPSSSAPSTSSTHFSSSSIVSSFQPSDWFQRRPFVVLAAALCTCALLYLLVTSFTAPAAGRLPLDVSLLHSNDTTPWQQIHKIDESGAYRRFDDITTVMKVRTTLHSTYRTAHTFLYSHTDLISPLPISSYHVTLVELMGLRRKRSLAAYNGNITANLYRMEQLKYNFAQLTQPFTFRLHHATHGDVDGHFSTAITLVVEPDTVDDANRLQQVLEMARTVLGDELWVEPVGSHMTLGYKVPSKGLDKMSVRYQPIVDEMERLYRDVKFVCDPPILSSVHDMLDFPPI